MSHILAAVPSAAIEFALYEGTVGHGAAIEFTGFLRVFRSLPSLDAILLNPATAPVPDEPSALCAVATGLARRTTEQNLLPVCRSAGPGIRHLAGEVATARLPGLAHHPAFIRWAVNNGAAPPDLLPQARPSTSSGSPMLP